MKVLIVGDSPLIQTGFGHVNGRVAQRLLSDGHEVISVAGLTSEAPEDTKGITIVVPTEHNDILGLKSIIPTVNRYKPDVLYMTADPGSATALSMGSPDMPAFAWVPIEGEPIVNQDWSAFLTQIPLATVSQYGADIIKRDLNKEVPWYYHGVNHDMFKVTDTREQMRKGLGWDDKFVIMSVATNVRRKQLTRLIEAFAQLKQRYNQKDMILYLHTVAYQNHWLEGWNLSDVTRSLGVEKDVFFHPDMRKRGDYIDQSQLVDIYNASDLFVLPSQVEGFGLPIAEAMACGVPVLVTQYGAGYEVAMPAGKGIPIADWEIHKSGTRYANVDVDALASLILKLKRNPKELAKMRQRGLERVRDFVWEPFLDDLTINLENSINAHEERSVQTEEEDKGQRGQGPEEEEVSLRTNEVEDGSAESSILTQRQGQDIGSGQQTDPNQQEAQEGSTMEDEVLSG